MEVKENQTNGGKQREREGFQWRIKRRDQFNQRPRPQFFTDENIGDVPGPEEDETESSNQSILFVVSVFFHFLFLSRGKEKIQTISSAGGVRKWNSQSALPFFLCPSFYSDNGSRSGNNACSPPAFALYSSLSLSLRSTNQRKTKRLKATTNDRNWKKTKKKKEIIWCASSMMIRPVKAKPCRPGGAENLATLDASPQMCG